MYFLYIPRDGLMMREWPYTASSWDELYPYTAKRKMYIVQTNTSRIEAVYGNIYPSLEIYQEIHPCGAISIDSA